MTTTSQNVDIRQILNMARPDQLADVLKAIKVGNMFSPVKAVVAGLGATATPTINSAATKAAATVTGITLRTGENLPPIGLVKSLQVIASGTAASLGSYIAGTAGSTPLIPPGGAQAAVGIFTLSEDGVTLTFPNTITAFTIEYIPRPYVAMTTEFPVGAPGGD
jgi:hypothetical protein